jgi:hypothetical protein
VLPRVGRGRQAGRALAFFNFSLIHLDAMELAGGGRQKVGQKVNNTEGTDKSRRLDRRLLFPLYWAGCFLLRKQSNEAEDPSPLRRPQR